MASCEHLVFKVKCNCPAIDCNIIWNWKIPILNFWCVCTFMSTCIHTHKRHIRDMCPTLSDYRLQEWLRTEFHVECFVCIEVFGTAACQLCHSLREWRGGKSAASGGCIYLNATTESKWGHLLYLQDTTTCVANKLCNYLLVLHV